MQDTQGSHGTHRETPVMLGQQNNGANNIRLAQLGQPLVINLIEKFLGNSEPTIKTKRAKTMRLCAYKTYDKKTSTKAATAKKE
jgi:hypothetical protein